VTVDQEHDAVHAVEHAQAWVRRGDVYGLGVFLDESFDVDAIVHVLAGGGRGVGLAGRRVDVDAERLAARIDGLHRDPVEAPVGVVANRALLPVGDDGCLARQSQGLQVGGRADLTSLPGGDLVVRGVVRLLVGDRRG